MVQSLTYHPSKVHLNSELRLGILGAGQLGRMLIQSAMNLGIEIHLLSPDENDPGAKFSQHHRIGNYNDFSDVYQFGKSVDLLTIEIENVNVEALKKLESEGIKVYPQPSVLELIQDKGLQKDFLKHNNFPTCGFIKVNPGTLVTDEKFPLILKYCKSGYDGKGVVKVHSSEEFNAHLSEPGILETYVDIKHEISVITARNNQGQIAVYDPVEMHVHKVGHMLDYLSCPASIPASLRDKAMQTAVEIINKLNMTGLLAVEFFIDQSGDLLVNELSPRPHNSGHHTIEACRTSQYQQLIRVILGMPLGSAELIHPVVMLNLIGQDGHEGITRFKGIEEFMGMENVHFHLYGKKTTKPRRKMGHVTVMDEDLTKAITIAESIRKHVQVTS